MPGRGLGAWSRRECLVPGGGWWRPPWTATAVGSTHPTGMHSCYIYQPQRSWAKVMFLQVSVILSTGGSASVHAGMPDPPRTRQTPLDQADTPPDQADPPRTRQTPQDQADPPRTRQTPPQTRQTPTPGRHHPTPPQTRQTPPPQDQADTPPEADASIWSMSSRYTSYWNAFLL